MRFGSTPESTANGEITVLAIVETLVAIFLSLVLVKLLDSAAHIVAGAVIVPFLLLRTEASTAKAFSIFDRCFQRLAGPVSWLAGFYDRIPPVLRSVTCLLIVLPLFSLALAIVKAVANVLALIESPRETLVAIPGNWLRVTFAMDHRHPPELLAGVERAAEAPPSVLAFRYEAVRSKLVPGTDVALHRKFGLLAIYAAAVLYRLFVKSASVIYFPLIWINQVPLTVKGILNLPLERVRRWYAYVLLIITLSPLLISFQLQDTLGTPQDRMVYTYVVPAGKLDWWHASRVVAVVVTIALYIYARKLGDDSLDNAEQERTIIASAHRVRAACAVFTMGCFLLIVLTL